ncbi:MAG TPA: 2-C-methyl-D-erythritol 2,4-cyclodiphosphate synthase [Thermoanaerobaculia bacterium]|nr:2-C-methyl-D-erythritol 2,4-cyclodiphosphate synthase [Thermoanaerobaculia bacterium]
MIRIGHGIDIHPFDETRPLILGGVRISTHGGLSGHSDADAVLHALTDALLGSVAAGDIGDHFPSSDPRWKDESSDRFVREALVLVERSGHAVVNVDITVIAQKPRLAEHRAAMVDSIASLLSLQTGSVSVKATTTDHLGFVGRGEGICAIATVAVSVPPEVP